MGITIKPSRNLTAKGAIAIKNVGYAQRAMYRLLAAHSQVGDRRRQRRHPLKYRPDFPARFGSIEDARAHCREFFHWYNTEHRHSGIGFMTPDIVHHGQSSAVTRQRAITLDTAFAAHPARFKGLTPQPPGVPAAVWINPPKKETTPPTITPNCSLNS